MNLTYLKPIRETNIDPFNFIQHKHFCDILDAEKDPTKETLETAKKPRLTCKTGIGDKSYFGPEPEFFVL